VVIVVREIAVTVQRLVLVRRDVIMPASVFGKAKTVSQVVAVTLYLMPGMSSAVRTAALVVAVAATVASGVEYAARGRRLLATQARKAVSHPEVQPSSGAAGQRSA
jgi:CDP-diacylglycerol--glycerol-3-phosphate 3-phosphatidyltransferase